MADETYHSDGDKTGIDNDPSGDAEKGAALGGIGGVVVGLAAGSMAGPIGAVIGAVVGGMAGAAASGAAVAAIDHVDNPHTGHGVGSTDAINSESDDHTVFDHADGVHVVPPTYLIDDNGGRFSVDSTGAPTYVSSPSAGDSADGDLHLRIDPTILLADRVFAPTSPLLPATLPRQVLVDLRPKIAERAYQLYEDRGHRDGQATHDWLDAERQILMQ